MSDPRQVRTFAAADAASFLGTFALIFLAIAALFALDTFLAKMERAESRSEARHFYQEGVYLAGQGQSLEAVDRFRTAASTERSNPVYQRALAAALLSAGRVADAEAVITDRLQRDPADAEASLIMARALVKEGKWTQAIPYYHRAIHGLWHEDPVSHRVKARFELVELLAGHDSEQELLAELLPLRREAPDNVETRRRIAHLLITAGALSSAIATFRDLLRRDPRDADAYAGLGKAEFERGNYRTALANFTAAARLDPNNPGIAAGLALCNQVLALDPTQRGLGLEERYRRSLALLELTMQAAASCAGAEPVRALGDSARTARARHAPATRRHLAVERNLDLAEQLWHARRKECPSPLLDSERPLALVLDKVGQ